MKIFLLLILSLVNAMAISQIEESTTSQQLDSAEHYFEDNFERSQLFLDSLESNLSALSREELRRFYMKKAETQYRLDRISPAFTSYQSALSIAEELGNMDASGNASVRLYLILLDQKKYEEAKKYREKAEFFYNKGDNESRKLEVRQYAPYEEFVRGNYQNCIDILTDDLHIYRAFKRNYLYAFSLNLLSLSSYELSDFNSGLKYAQLLDELENTEGPVPNFIYYKAGISSIAAKKYLEVEKVDSAKLHLKKIYQLGLDSKLDLGLDFYQLAADVYEADGDDEMKLAYLDSLSDYQAELYAESLADGIENKESLSTTQAVLETTENYRQRNLFLAIGALLVSLILAVVFYRNYQSIRGKLFSVKNKIGELTYFKKNHEKLTAKVHGLEEYIKNLKGEIKSISHVADENEQRQRIKDLYKNVHLNSSNVFRKEESHLQIISELNSDFFAYLGNKFPDLNNSDLIICYYLHMGFKTKEIAVFLNSSNRAIESKCFRIRKKIELTNKEVLLKDHIDTLVSDSNLSLG